MWHWGLPIQPRIGRADGKQLSAVVTIQIVFENVVEPGTTDCTATTVFYPRKTIRFASVSASRYCTPSPCANCSPSLAWSNALTAWEKQGPLLDGTRTLGTGRLKSMVANGTKQHLRPLMACKGLPRCVSEWRTCLLPFKGDLMFSLPQYVGSMLSFMWTTWFNFVRRRWTK